LAYLQRILTNAEDIIHETIDYQQERYETHIRPYIVYYLDKIGQIECTKLDTSNGLNRKGSTDMVYQHRIVIHASNGFTKNTTMVLLLITHNLLDPYNIVYNMSTACVTIENNTSCCIQGSLTPICYVQAMSMYKKYTQDPSVLIITT
jgi:hypothetical protein